MERKDFPRDTEERLSAILNVVNGGFKNVGFLHLDDVPVVGNEIKARVRDSAGKGYLPYYNCFDSYCRDSLMPIGMVAKDVNLLNGKIGYILTPEGRKYGIPVSTFSLDWEFQNDTSLFSVLGATCSNTGERAPLRRIKLLEELTTGGALSPSSIFDKFGGSFAMYHNHILPLSAAGFVKYTSNWMHEHGTRTSCVLLDDPSSYDDIKYPNKARKVVDCLKDNQGDSIAKISLKSGIDQGSVSRIINSLFSHGYVGDKSVGAPPSARVTVTAKGEHFLNSYINPVRAAISRDEDLKTMEDTAEFIFSDAELFGAYCRNSIDLYREVSPWVNRTVTSDDVLDQIKSNPGIRPFEIAKAIGVRAVDKRLASLLRDGRVSVQRDGRRSHYTAV